MKHFRTMSGIQHSGMELFLLPTLQYHSDIVKMTTTSVCDVMEDIFDNIIRGISTHNEEGVEQDTLIPNLFQALFQAWYKEVDQSHILLMNEDIARHLWPLQNFLDPNVKHVFFYRSLPDLVQCHVREADEDPGHPINVLMFKNGKEQTRDNRARTCYKMINQHFFSTFETLNEHFEKDKDFFIINYDEFIKMSSFDRCNKVLRLLDVPEIDKSFHEPMNNTDIQFPINNVEEDYFTQETKEFLASVDKIGKVI